MNHYKYVHLDQSIGENYYRIKQIDYNGQFSYSNLVFVLNRAYTINVYPNPVVDKLTVRSPHNNNVLIFNQKGQKVGNYKLNKGHTNIDMSQLRSGVYFLKFLDGTIERVIKSSN